MMSPQFLETCGAASALESGKPTAKSEGVYLLRKENTAAAFEVGSGTYDFTASQ